MASQKAYRQAKKRAEAKLGFFIHLMIYLLVNVILFVVDIAASPETLWFYWPMTGWGVGVLLHGLLVFFRPSGFNLKQRLIRAELEQLQKDEKEDQP